MILRRDHLSVEVRVALGPVVPRAAILAVWTAGLAWAVWAWVG